MTEYAAAPVVAPTLARQSLFRRLLRNPVAVAALAFLAVVAVVAVVGRWIAPVDPTLSSLQLVVADPSAAHPLGGDSAGRDVLSRLLSATQISIAGALLALVVALLVGVVGGLIAGYYGGLFDTVSSWLTAIVMALPAIVVLLAARAALGPSIWVSMAIFGVLLSPAFFRLVHVSVRAVRDELYVDAARVAGLSDARIIGRHILGVVRAPIIIQSAVLLGIAIAVQSGLEFLGLGDQAVPTWGGMLNDGFAQIYRAPVLMLWPSLAIGLTSMALVLVANAARDELERSAPRARARRPPAAGSDTRVDRPAMILHPDDRRTSALDTDVLLRVRNLVVAYDREGEGSTEVVKGVDLEVRRGEVHGLIGESGSGKTQTAFAILGLLSSGGHIEAGSIEFAGDRLDEGGEGSYARVRGRRIAYVPQEPMSNLDPSFTIGSQLVEPMRVVLGLSRGEARSRALALLERVGIPDPAHAFAAYPHEISGGMAQRVLIAGAVSCDPELVIADEPTTALDVTVQAEVLDLLRDLQRERGMAVLIVTHNFGVVADLCDRVSVMQSGRIVESGPVDAIFDHPEHEYTCSLLGAILEDGDARKPLESHKEITR
ncbi:dipeptide/oligopeptide/nickel ABC transporter permease/ATP-binding protein [Labedella phragmitis]|uniref:Dipeptide/oligopeptide/nickel ABC transporter permease/ATP-binding protein n=1 Tax=Labedella phragmitis TaxID=2498849 RepID=A0A3S3Z809_9MICO|nr:dipeptide/oligopeptide/nickel ABC transporter permease/ATP-binding protein [Labedella phragmitis]RWZ50820.1 dipeptide/oligopeptide/nickel ABC transporter permease/ATP-binding protein [Labedella phragmitis]